MFIDVADKKAFLIWLVNNVTFAQREILWILNYLINHEAILINVRFVEHADKTNRGIQISSVEMEQKPIMLYLGEKKFSDTDQIFHEIRMNWQDPLYLECIFENAWQNSDYLSILEDNPFARWNEHVDEEILATVDHYLHQQEIVSKMALLYQQIDCSLEDGDVEAFLELTTELNHLKMTESNSLKRK